VVVIILIIVVVVVIVMNADNRKLAQPLSVDEQGKDRDVSFVQKSDEVRAHTGHGITLTVGPPGLVGY